MYILFIESKGWGFFEGGVLFACFFILDNLHDSWHSAGSPVFLS